MTSGGPDAWRLGLARRPERRRPEDAAYIGVGTAGRSREPIEVPAGGTGIVVESGVGANVILRDLTIIGVPGCSSGGAGIGVDVRSGSNLQLEHDQISGFGDSGLKLEPG